MRKFDQQQFEQILKKRFFIAPSAHIYGGISGLYDLGPPALSVKTSMLALWRRHFVQEEDMFEVETSAMLPYDALKASGHVDRFCDILVFDEVTGDCYRADHLLEDILGRMEQTERVMDEARRLDCMSCVEIDEIVSRYDVRSANGNKLSRAQRFNLMFGTEVGYKGAQQVFLRPETAQGQFLNFKRLYEYNNERLPFASVSVGRVYRNEISPRSGLVRVREFEQAEIEHFVFTDEKDHPKFANVEDVELKLVYGDKSDVMSLRDAVAAGTINNQTLGYYIGRTYLFLVELGIDEKLVRFRQHKKDEMAHYAKDCWDAEIFMSCGWVECVGIADRSCYDLTCHEKATKVNLKCKRRLSEPRKIDEWVLDLDKRKWGPKLRDRFGVLKEMIDGLSQEYIESNLEHEEHTYLKIEFDGHFIDVSCEKISRKVFVENVIPDVIEPSFGVGRILQALFEHSFYLRDDGRPVFAFRPSVAPVHCAIGCLVHSKELDGHIARLKSEICDKGLTVHVNDRSCSIGRKYASCDELGIPFFITFDPDFKNDGMVTIRERDSMKQTRIDVRDCASAVLKYVMGCSKWN